MTKVISLSEAAYKTLRRMKRAGESFSDVVLRMAKRESARSLLEFAGKWKGDDISSIFEEVIRERETAITRKVEI